MEPILGTLVLLGGALLWLVDRGAAVQLGLEHVVGLAGLLVLGQGLARDLTVIARRRKRVPAAPQSEELDAFWELNLCLESTLGTALMILAALLWFAPGAGIRFSVPRGFVGVAAGGVICAGWLTRDWVLTLRHVRDHYDLPVWRRGHRKG